MGHVRPRDGISRKGTPNGALKGAYQLPHAPGCGAATADNTATDSVMVRLRLRAPTNAKAFSFNSYFFSAEYPEYVCSTYNDQLIALVDTPSGTPTRSRIRSTRT
jgi:hypothetical protein